MYSLGEKGNIFGESKFSIQLNASGSRGESETLTSSGFLSYWSKLLLNVLFSAEMCEQALVIYCQWKFEMKKVKIKRE